MRDNESFFGFLYPSNHSVPLSDILRFLYTLIILSAFIISINNYIEIQKLNRQIIDSQLFVSGTEVNGLIPSSEEYSSIYNINTELYNFTSDKVYDGHFRVVFKNQPTQQNLHFKVIDDVGRDVTITDIQIVQSVMEIKFRTRGYTTDLNLKCKFTEKNLIISSLTFHAEGSYIKGFL